MSHVTTHLNYDLSTKDPFCQEHLPPLEQQPVFVFDRPEIQYPAQLNCVAELLDKHLTEGRGENIAIYFDDQSGQASQWTYAQLAARVNRIANVLILQETLQPGNRVLLRGLNGPMMAACFLAVIKAGLVAVPTMPMLRARELKQILDKAQVRFALCEASLFEELAHTLNPQHEQHSASLKAYLHFAPDDSSATEAHDLQSCMSQMLTSFKPYESGRDDTCLIAFTSGTTGQPKGTMHFHRDVLAMCDLFPRSILNMQESDIVIGTPPLAFTFGLGGLLAFPMRVGAATVLRPKYTPESLMQAIAKYQATLCFTAPTFYRQMAGFAQENSTGSLRHSISAGEALPLAIRKLWHEKTALAMTDGIGGTEMIHIYIATAGSELHQAGKWGALGKVVPGYQAQIVDDAMRPLPHGQVGKLAVRGPTGCRYLDDARQTNYVKAGWNLPGDSFMQDELGYFYYQARNDDMIISAGYNIAGPEVEAALMEHAAVADCGVIGSPDEERGQIVHAFVILKENQLASEALILALQDHVKQTIAPFKYPRRISFCKVLPRTETGKLQRFKLKDQPMTSSTNASQNAPLPNSPHQVLQPEGWLAPKGYANGIDARGRQIFLAGMIGWDGQCQFHSDDFVQQADQALRNIIDTLACAKAGPEHIVRMTWYVKNKKEYLSRAKELGAVYKRVIGRNFPVMTLVQVADLVEDRALLEIEATAVIPDA